LDAHPAPAWLDQWRPWLAVTIALILIAYGPVLIQSISNLNLVPGVPAR